MGLASTPASPAVLRAAVAAGTDGLSSPRMARSQTSRGSSIVFCSRRQTFVRRARRAEEVENLTTKLPRTTLGEVEKTTAATNSQFTCDSGSCCLGSEARLRLQGGRFEGEQSAHRRTRSVGVIGAGAGAGAGSCDGASAPRRRAWCRQALRGKRFGCASSCRALVW